MTYGCLLRPHREIRELTWRDFTEDLAYIKRSGLRNKSGRNRISAISTFFIFWLEQAAQLKTNKCLKQKTPTKLMRVSCDRDRIRTCDRLLRRQMLYPAELLIYNNLQYCTSLCANNVQTFMCFWSF